MDDARAERMAGLFEQALMLAPDRRAGFLEELARREPEAHAELSVLLASHEAAPDYLEGLAERLLPGAVRGLGDVGPSNARGPGGGGPGRTPPPRPDSDAGREPADLTDELAEGRIVGRYRIQGRLGRGGMGVVYRAVDPALDRPVALKFLPSHLGADPRARTRLIAEARAASALDHPNIAVVHEIGTLSPDDGEVGPDRLFIAMACYDGPTLRDELAGGPRPLSEAVEYGTQLAAGLARAHEAGIVHRDVKPANLIVTDRGLKIVDFGIARAVDRDVTREEVTPGTIAYMSPEQTRGGPIDPRTDVWSAGVVLYEMVAGRRPFRGADDAVLIHAIRHDPVPPLHEARPEVPRELERLIHRCLEKNASARYPDGGALHEALLDARARSARRPRRVLFAAAVAAVVAVLALVLLPVSPHSGVEHASASTILVLPLLPPADDTTLARLGRDLAVTLSAALDGIGDIRTVDASTVLAHLPDPDAARATAAVARFEVARRLGAGSVLTGSVVRDGPNVRADTRLIVLTDAADEGVPEATGDASQALVEAGATDALARATAYAAADSLGALTDSLALGLVRQLLRGDPLHVPSLGAVTTRSVPALRAYVDGEQAMAGGDMTRAVEAFERAFEADSTFWFAYWRSLYPRVYEGSPADTAVLAEVYRRRDELPERDRLLVEAGRMPTVTERVEALDALIRRYPSYWPAAWNLANLHVHWSPFLGHSVADARTGLERVVTLNPRFASAWHHLLWIAPLQGDYDRARTALETLERLVDPAEHRWEVNLTTLGTALEALEQGGAPSPQREAEMADVIRQVGDRVPDAAVGFGGTFVPYGLAAMQIRINRRVLASAPGRAYAPGLRMANTMAWAARGAWDSVAVELEGWTRVSTDPRDALRAYGLGVLGVVLDGWEVDRAASLRRAAVGAAAEGDPDDRAELAWLDGVLASWSYSSADRSALADARDRLQHSGATHAAMLDGSLKGFQQAALRDERAAARTLERIELDAGERWAAGAYAGRHPYLFAVNRLHAGRWLLAAGDTTAAARLLEWCHGIPGTPDSFRDTFAAIAVLPFVLAEKARIATARGRTEEAADHYRRILRHYDLPSSPRGVALVEEARAALAAGGGPRR
jgi:tetratricopeptide (TPR) repeat protein/TolB-like protein